MKPCMVSASGIDAPRAARHGAHSESTPAWLRLSKVAATTGLGHGAKPAPAGHINARRAYHNGQLGASATCGTSVCMTAVSIQKVVVVSRAPLTHGMAQVFAVGRTYHAKKECRAEQCRAQSAGSDIDAPCAERHEAHS